MTRFSRETDLLAIASPTKLTQNLGMPDLVNIASPVENSDVGLELERSADAPEFELSRLWLEIWLSAKVGADQPSAIALRAAPEELREHLVIHLTRPTELWFSGNETKLLDVKLANAYETLSAAKLQIARQAFRVTSEEVKPTLTKMIHPKAKLFVETLTLPARPSLKDRGMCVSSVVSKPLTDAMRNLPPVQAVVLDVC